MPTNDERREVAARMQEPTVSTDVNWPALMDALGARTRDGAILRLADLIDPTDKTCELELTWGGQTNAYVRTYECSRCGKSCDNIWGEDYEFCPYCGRRINHADE